MLVDPVGNSVGEMSQNNDYEPLEGKIRHGIWLQLPKLTTNAESEAQLYEKLLGALSKLLLGPRNSGSPRSAKPAA
jgi:hypothetical protein